MVCPHTQGRFQCGHFADKGEGSIFHDFVRTFVMDDPIEKFNQNVFNSFPVSFIAKFFSVLGNKILSYFHIRYTKVQTLDCAIIANFLS